MPFLLTGSGKKVRCRRLRRSDDGNRRRIPTEVGCEMCGNVWTASETVPRLSDRFGADFGVRQRGGDDPREISARSPEPEHARHLTR